MANFRLLISSYWTWNCEEMLTISSWDLELAGSYTNWITIQTFSVDVSDIIVGSFVLGLPALVTKNGFSGCIEISNSFQEHYPFRELLLLYEKGNRTQEQAHQTRNNNPIYVPNILLAGWLNVERVVKNTFLNLGCMIMKRETVTPILTAFQVSNIKGDPNWSLL